mmetsp:Transcript_35800/g.111205  ORF Transcript_35800/g.111205 Transcript_35800/m.111205 type:complete len:209 (-) Transcript_35800:28-654(-)
MAPWLKDPEPPVNDAHLKRYAERNSASWAALLYARAVSFCLFCLLGLSEVLVACRHWGDFRESLLAQWLLADGTVAVAFGAAHAFRLVQRAKVMGNLDLHVYLLRKDRGAPDDAEREGQMENALLDRLLGRAGVVLVLLFAAGCYCYWVAVGGAGGDSQLQDFACLVLALRLVAPGMTCSVSLLLSAYVFWRRNPSDSTYWDDLYTDA